MTKSKYLQIGILFAILIFFGSHFLLVMNVEEKQTQVAEALDSIAIIFLKERVKLLEIEHQYLKKEISSNIHVDLCTPNLVSDSERENPSIWLQKCLFLSDIEFKSVSLDKEFGEVIFNAVDTIYTNEDGEMEGFFIVQIARSNSKFLTDWRKFALDSHVDSLEKSLDDEWSLIATWQRR